MGRGKWRHFQSVEELWHLFFFLNTIPCHLTALFKHIIDQNKRSWALLKYEDLQILLVSGINNHAFKELPCLWYSSEWYCTSGHTVSFRKCNLSCYTPGFCKSWMRYIFTAKSDKPDKTIDFSQRLQGFLIALCFQVNSQYLSSWGWEVVTPRLLALPLLKWGHVSGTESQKSSTPVLLETCSFRPLSLLE